MSNTQVILNNRPGKDFLSKIPETFTIVTTPLPAEIKEGEFLLRVDFLSIDPIMRVWMTGAPTYLPVLKPGNIIHSYGVGEVVVSKNPSWRVGDKCVGNTGAQQFCVCDKVRQVFLFKIPHKTKHSEMAFFLPLVNNWFVAYQGIIVDGRVKKGETVVVSSAAGATGIVCVQLAKQAGARVVGIAGGAYKCAHLKSELKVDEMIDYKDTSESFFTKLKRACPKGVDVYFDNVGDAMLDDVLRLMNLNGRVSLCGASSNYDDHANRMGIKNLSNIVVKRLQVKGVLASEVSPISHIVVPELLNKVRSGEMKSIEVYFEGIHSVPKAMQCCFEGKNIGKVLVDLNHRGSPKL